MGEDNLFILLQSKLDNSSKSVTDLNNQIKALGLKLDSLNINLNFDDKILKDLNNKVNELVGNTNISIKADTKQANREIKQLANNLEKISQVSVNGNTTKNIFDYNEGLGQHRKIVEVLGEETAIIETTTLNYKEQNREIQKQVDMIAMLDRQKKNMLSQMGVLASKKDVDKTVYDDMIKRINELSADTENYKNLLKDLGVEYQILNRESKAFTPMGNNKLSTQIDVWKTKMASLMNVMKRDKTVDNKAFDKLALGIKKVSIESNDAQAEMKKLDAIYQAMNRESLKKSMPNTMSDYEKNIRAMTEQWKLGILAIDEYISKMEQVLRKKDGSYAGQFWNQMDEGGRSFANNNLNKAQGELDRALKSEKNTRDAITKAIEKQEIAQDSLNFSLEEYKKMQNSRLTSLENKGTDINKINDMRDAINGLTSDTPKLKNQMKSLSNDITVLGRETQKTSKTMEFLARYFGVYEAIQLTKQAVGSMVSSIKELDSSIVEVMKVTSLAEDQIDSFTKKAFEMSESVGRTGTEMIDATAAFSRAGYGLQEAMDLGQVALTMANVGDGMVDIENNANTIISIMKGFGESTQFASESLDILNNVSNNSAISFSDLSEGLRRTSAVYNQSGVGIEKLSGLLVGANEVMMNIEKSSTGLITISQRLRGVTEAFEEDPENISRLDKAFREIAGIDIRDTNGQIRDTFSILEDLKNVYPSLTKNQQQYIGELAAGKRQINVLQSLLMNWEGVENAIVHATNATGSAQKEQEAFLNSIQGKLNQMSNAWKELSMTTISSDFIKGVVDATTNIIKLIDACGGLQTVVIGVGVAFATWKGITYISSLVGGISSMAEMMIGLKLAIDGATISQLALNAAMKLSIAGAIVAGIMGIGYAIKTIADSCKTAEEKVIALNGELQKLNSDKNNTTQLASRYEELKELSKHQELTNEEQREFVDIQNELKSVMPQVTGYYSEQGDFIITQTDLVENLNKQYEHLIALKLEERKVAALSMAGTFVGDISKSEDMLKYEIEQFEFLKSIRDDLKNDKVNLSDDDYNVLMTDYDKQLEDARVRIENIRASILGLKDDATSTIMGVVVSTKQWTDATKEERQAIEDVVLSMSDTDKIQDFLVNTEGNLSELMSGFRLGINSTKEFSDGSLSMSEYMYRLGIVSKKTGISIADLNKLFDDYIHVIDDAGNESDVTEESISRLNEQLQEQMGIMNSQVSNYDLLISAIEKLSSGQQLSGNEINALTSSYEELIPKIDETTGQMYLELDAIVELAGKEGEEAQKAITLSISKTKQLAYDSAKRIGVILDEVIAVNSAADAYALLANAATTAHGGYRPTGIDDATWGKSANHISVGINGIIKDLAHLYEEAEKTSNNMSEVDLLGGKDKKGSSKGDKPSDKFKANLEEIKLIREQIQREIDLIQEKMNLAELTGDTKTFDELANKMTVLKDELRGISEIQIKGTADIQGYEQLQKIYTKKEELAELESLIANARKQGYIDESSYQEHLIDIKERKIALIEREFEASQRAYDNEYKRLEIEQSLLEQSSQEYQDMEQEKINILISKQEDYLNTIKQLNAEGLSNENETVREYIDMWVDAYSQRLQMEKQMAEQRRQNAIKANQDSMGGLREMQNAPKELLDMVMSMLKQETQAKRDELKKQLDDTKDKLKEEFDAEKERLEKERDERKKALKDKLDGIQKEADARKDALRKEQDERNYAQGLAEKEKQISDIEEKILALSNDDSIQAQKKRKELEAELIKYKQELADYQYDHEVSMREDAIDNELNANKDKIEDELEALDDKYDKELDMLDKKHKDELKKLEEKYKKEMQQYEDLLSSQKKLRDEALALIEKGERELYDKLIAWNDEYGSGISEDISSAWDQAYSAMDKYGQGTDNVLTTIVNMREEMEKLAAEAERLQDTTWKDFTDDNDIADKPDRPTNKPNNGGSSGNDKLDSKTIEKLQQMVHLGDMMAHSNKETVQAYIKKQKELAGEVGAFMDNDQWYIMVNGKKVKIRDAVKMRHQGLTMGNLSDLKPNETMLRATKDEWVSTGDQYSNLSKNLDGLLKVNKSESQVVQPSIILQVGSVTKDSLPDLKKFIKTEVPKVLDNMLYSRGIK